MLTFVSKQLRAAQPRAPGLGPTCRRPEKCRQNLKLPFPIHSQAGRSKRPICEPEAGIQLQDIMAAQGRQ